MTTPKNSSIHRVKSPINFKPASVRPICLPLDSFSQPLAARRSGLVTGWGSTEDGASTSDVLLKVRLPIVPNEACTRAYRDQPFVRISHRQLCAGGTQPGRDSCSGDSGGPLQVVAMYRGQPRSVQRGIVSFGRRTCASQGSPGVYTNVAYYVDWILDTMEE